MRKHRNSRSVPVPSIYFDQAAGWRFLPNRAARRSPQALSYQVQAYLATQRLGAGVAALLVGVEA